MKTIAFIGDSHAKVVFRYMKKMMPAIKLRHIATKSENGWSLKKHISKGTLSLLKKEKPDIILVSLGGNNQNMNTRSYKSTVDDLIKTAKSLGSQIVWVGPTTSDPNVAPNTERRHKWTHEFLSKYLPSQSVTYIDNRSFTAGGWKKDGVHYPSSFYKRWAERVTKYLPEAVKNDSKSNKGSQIAILGAISALSLTVLAIAGKIALGGKGTE